MVSKHTWECTKVLVAFRVWVGTVSKVRQSSVKIKNPLLAVYRGCGVFRYGGGVLKAALGANVEFLFDEWRCLTVFLKKIKQAYGPCFFVKIE